MKTDDIIDNANLDYLKAAEGVEPQGKDQPPAPAAEFQWIGRRVPRVNGRLIVTGRAKYTHDLSFEGLLHARILRSPHGSAEIVSLDTAPAESLPGVAAVLKLKEGRVKYEGEQVAAVAAVDEPTAEKAAGLIKVVYKELPHVISAEAGLAEAAPRVHDTPNVQKFNEYNRGDVVQGFAAAEVILERTYRTSFEIHQPLETHASIAWWKDGELTVWDSTQAVHNTRDQLARMLGIPAGKLRVICQYMGAGFGSAREAVRWHVAMQAQDYAPAAWSVGQRSRGVRAEDLDAALAEGTIVRTHVLRPTWHFVAADDIQWLLALSGPRVRQANAGRYRELGLDARTRTRCERVIARALEGGTA